MKIYIKFKTVCFVLFISIPDVSKELPHWGRVTPICVGKLTIIGSDNGLSPGRRQPMLEYCYLDPKEETSMKL